MKPSRTTAILNVSLAIAFILTAAVKGYTAIGLPPVVIVGVSGAVALIAWSRTYLLRPASTSTVVPLFLLTVAALEVHMTEEYLTRFGPAMSRLFNITWTERGFLLVFAFIGPALYALTAIGLVYRVRFSGFLAWFIFIGPGIAEFTHFIFPLIRPANYYIGTTGSYYFSGLYTAVLPMIPGIYTIYRLLRNDKRTRGK